ncbi:MAG: LysR family transcriptional regulator [Burkholderiaceae bacterium]|nr:LysR family transcriptional regulator [Burkholderiaceae bacterium]
MDKFSAMQAFIRVVEAGTFTRAADSMDLPKARVTRLIQMLESELQTRLLNRTTRRVTVTADGAAYYERAVRLLGDLEELEAGMSRARAQPRGRLKVDCSAAVAGPILIPALPDFHARYPDIRLELGVSDRPVDLLGDNVDCVLRGGEITDLSMVARKIGETALLTCATPDYLRRHGVPRHPQDLDDPEKGHELVRYFSPRTGRINPFLYTRGDESVSIEGRYRLALDDVAAIVAAGIAGLGIIHAPSFLVQEHIGSGVLEPLLLDWSAASVALHVVYPPNRHLSNKVRVFVDWVADLFENHDLVQRKSTFPRRAA